MTRERRRAAAEIDAALEFRSLIRQVAGPGAADPIRSARDLFEHNHRTVERWYTGVLPVPSGILVQLRGYVVAVERMRTDLASVRSDAAADGLSDIVVALNMRSFGEGLRAERMRRLETSAETVPEPQEAHSFGM